MRRALKAAERYDRALKPKGRRNGPLGHVGLEVYRALWSVVSFQNGRLDPSISWLEETCGRSRAAIVAGLKRLKSCGFLKWLRRLEYSGGPRGVRGPQGHQVTNAYQLLIPAAALALLPNVALPECEVSRLSELAALRSMWEAEAAADSPLGKALARLRLGVEQRESTGRSQSHLTDFSKGLAAGLRPAAG